MVKSSEVLMPTIVNKFVNSVQLKTFPNALHKSATMGNNEKRDNNVQR